MRNINFADCMALVAVTVSAFICFPSNSKSEQLADGRFVLRFLGEAIAFPPEDAGSIYFCENRAFGWGFKSNPDANTPTAADLIANPAKMATLIHNSDQSQTLHVNFATWRTNAETRNPWRLIPVDYDGNLKLYIGKNKADHKGSYRWEPPDSYREIEGGSIAGFRRFTFDGLQHSFYSLKHMNVWPPSLQRYHLTRNVPEYFVLDAKMRSPPAEKDLFISCSWEYFQSRRCRTVLCSKDEQIVVSLAWDIEASRDQGLTWHPFIETRQWEKEDTPLFGQIDEWRDLDRTLREIATYVLVERPAGDIQ